MDEFGKGTSPTSGMSLLAAAIDALSSQHKCRAVITTHFLELFSMGLLVDGRGGIVAKRMAVYEPEGDDEDPVPLFTMEGGVASSSDGLVCAKVVGLDSAVVKRAEEILRSIKPGGGDLNPLPDIPFERKRKSLVRSFLRGGTWADSSSDQIDDLKTKIRNLLVPDPCL